MFARAIVFVALILVAATPKNSFAGGKEEAFYMIVWASQDDGNRAKASHTFATFVKTNGKGKNAEMESHTISWLPESLDIVILRRLPEPGKNFDLKSTLSWCQTMRFKVTMWGPYQIKKGLYERALRQEARLNKKAIAYKALDIRFRPETASNCIHAVSDLDTEKGILETGTLHGEAASLAVLNHLGGWIIDRKKTHPGVSKRLELEKYTIAVATWNADVRANRTAPKASK